MFYSYYYGNAYNVGVIEVRCSLIDLGFQTDVFQSQILVTKFSASTIFFSNWRRDHGMWRHVDQFKAKKKNLIISDTS